MYIKRGNWYKRKGKWNNDCFRCCFNCLNHYSCPDACNENKKYKKLIIELDCSICIYRSLNYRYSKPHLKMVKDEKYIGNIKLNQIKEECTKPNWNYYDAPAIRVHDIKVAKKVFNNFINIIPEVFPTAKGTIRFEFEYDNIYLEFELIRTNKKEYKLEWIKMINYEGVDVGIISSRDYEKMNKLVADTFAEVCF